MSPTGLYKFIIYITLHYIPRPCSDNVSLWTLVVYATYLLPYLLICCDLFVEVVKPNTAIELSSYREQENMWIGPRQVSFL